MHQKTGKDVLSNQVRHAVTCCYAPANQQVPNASGSSHGLHVYVMVLTLQ